MSIEKEQVSCHTSIATPRSQPSAAREETVPSGEKHFAAPQGWNPGWVPWFGGFGSMSHIPLSRENCHDISDGRAHPFE